MEKAYIILAHRNPTQLVRLLRKLDDDHSTFFIHIDKRVPMTAFSGLMNFGEKVHLVKRVISNWATFGLVQATINALQEIRQSSLPFQRIILLSGQDYPIKTNKFINDFFTSTPYSVFIESVMLPDYNRWKPGGGIYRVNKYFFGFHQYQKLTAKTFNMLGIIVPFLKRKAPGTMIPYAGSQWWTIDMYALNYILDFLKNNSAYRRFHKATFAPDELFFQGILLNAKDEKLLNSIANDHKRYINWEDTRQCHPEVLQKYDFDEIEKSDALFARKFDAEVDDEILDLIDSRCLSTKPYLKERETAHSDSDLNN